MNYLQIPIHARAPLRLGLAGGGTDVDPYSSTYGGVVLNATVTLFSHARITPREQGYEWHAVDLGSHHQAAHWSMKSDQLDLQLHHGVQEYVATVLNRPLAPHVITTWSDAPPGSGLGTSSTMVVALLMAYNRWLDLGLSRYELASTAYHIERERIGLKGGKQDQYAAAFGGVNFIEFGKDLVRVNPLDIPPEVLSELESSLVVFYTGKSRESSRIIEEQISSASAGKAQTIESMHAIKQQAVQMKEALLRGRLDQLADILKAGWEAKKKLSSVVTNATIDTVYQSVIARGGLAGKVSGAGGGGVMMFLVAPQHRPAVLEYLDQLDHGHVLTCTFTPTGATAWRSAGL